MKHFTKDFYAMELLASANQFVKKSKSAEQKDENFYRKVYDEQCAVWVHNDSMNDHYRDTAADLRKIDDYINEPNITEEERNRRIQFKKMHVYLHGDGSKRKTVYPFNEEHSKQKFAANQNRFIEIYGNLPQEILDKIADIRVFALGYASAEVKRLLRPYCAGVRKKVQQIRETAYAETDEAERSLKEPIGLNDFEEFLIMKIEEKNGDVFIEGEDDVLVIRNGVITEGKEKPIFPYNREIPDCAWSQVLTAELHREDDTYELGFLVSNLNENNESDVWYFTVRGTDVELRSAR